MSWLIVLKGISTDVGYFMPNSVLYIYIYIYIYIICIRIAGR